MPHAGHRPAFAFSLVLSAALPLLASHVAAEPRLDERDIAALAPERTLVYAEAPGLSDLARAGLEHPFLRAVLGSELGALLLSEHGGDPSALLEVGALALGRPVLPAVASLTAHGAFLGVTFGRGGPAWVLVTHGDDDLLVDELLERASALIADRAGVEGLFDEPHATLKSADVWYLGETVLARRETLVVLSSDEGYLRDVLDLAADEGATGLLANERFRAARERSRGGALAWAYADRARLEELAGRFPGGADGFAELARGARTPQAQFLLGPGMAALAEGEAYAASLRVDGQEIGLEIAAIGARPRAAVAPGADDRPPAPPAAGDGVAAAVLYRDFGGLFEHRAELFEPDALPGIALGASQLALLFGGMDLGEDLLPRLSPWLRVVARPAQWTEGLRPDFELPAAALLVDLVDAADAEEIGAALVSAFQSAVSIANVQAAQEGMAAMTLALSLEGEVQVTSARLPRPRAGEGVDVRHNLAPACALVGRTFVLGTHESVVRGLVRELEAGRTAAAGGAPAELLAASGPALASYVERNSDALVAQRVLEAGLTPEAARGEIEGLRALLALLGEMRLELRYGADAVELAGTARLTSSGTGEAGGGK